MAGSPYAFIPWLGQIAEYAKGALEFAKKCCLPDGKLNHQYEGYFVLDDEGDLEAYALMRKDILMQNEFERENRIIRNHTSLEKHYAALAEFYQNPSKQALYGVFVNDQWVPWCEQDYFDLRKDGFECVKREERDGKTWALMRDFSENPKQPKVWTPLFIPEYDHQRPFSDDKS